MTSPAATTTLDDELRAFFAGDREHCADPYPLYSRLRDCAPVYWFGSDVLVSSHAEAKLAYTTVSVFTSGRVGGRFSDSARLLDTDDVGHLERVLDVERLQMSALNGEEHRRVRAAAHRYFTPRRVAELAALAQKLTDDALDELAAEETPDLTRLCYRVPLLVIGHMLGAPPEHAAHLKQLSDAVTAYRHRSPLDATEVQSAEAAHIEFRRYVEGLIEHGRSDPRRTALTAALLDANEADHLTLNELVANMVLLLIAGHETTANFLGNATVALMRNRDQWTQLCQEPALIGNAVEELLRYDPPTQSIGRTTAVDTRLGGIDIPRGTVVRLMNAAANRDPRAFAQADRLDLRRGRIDHLTLGYGPHYCLGNTLARLEGRTVLASLARRFPAMELAGDVIWHRDPQMHGATHLPVRLAA